MDWSNLKADYERLGSYAAVAAEYGVSKGYVAQQAKKQGINPKPEGRHGRFKIAYAGRRSAGLDDDLVAARRAGRVSSTKLR